MAVAARVANEPISAVPSRTVTNVASEAVARCRSEAKASRVMTPPLVHQLVEVGHLSGDRVGGGPVHPARDPSVDEEDHGVGVRRRDRVVGDHDDRLAAASSTQARSRAEHLVRGRGVEGAGRLVGQDDGGVGDQRPGDRDALLLAAGELRGQAPAPSPRPTCSSSARTRFRSTRCPASRIGQPDVLLGGEVGHQVEALEDEPDPLAAEPGRSSSLQCVMSSPAMTTRPSVGRSRPAAQVRNVDLPDPDGPITAVKEPEGKARSTPARAGRRPPPRRTCGRGRGPQCRGEGG